MNADRLDPHDKLVLENAQLKVELAKSKVDNAQLNYNNLMLQIVVKYDIKGQDALMADGSIKRTEEVKEEV